MKIAKVCKIVTMSKISCTWDKILHVCTKFFYFFDYFKYTNLSADSISRGTTPPSTRY